MTLPPAQKSSQPGINSAPSPTQAAEIILTLHRFITLSDTYEILVYKDGVYGPGEALLKKLAETVNPDATNHYVREVRGHIERLTFRDRYEFDLDTNIVNVANGLLDLRSGTLSPHTPEYLSRIRIPLPYYTKARCPRIMAFLRWALPAADVVTVLEEFGSTLWRSAAMQRAYIWFGEGSNGKSTALKLLTAVLGQDNVSHVQLQELEYNRFKPAELDGKLANIYADISPDELRHTGTLKTLIAGDPKTVEKKNRDPFTLNPTAKQIYSANMLPQTWDVSDAFFRRWIPTEWRNTVTDDQKDPHLIEKLTTQEELQGLLYIMVLLASKVMKKGDITNSPSVEAIKEVWGLRADAIEAFFNECVVVDTTADPPAFYPKGEMYTDYVLFCRKNKVRPLSRRAFNDRVRDRPWITETRPSTDNGQIKAWGNVWKKPAPQYR